MPSKWRLTVNLSEECLKGLEEWARQQKRTTSNLAAAILEFAYEAHKQGINDPAELPSSVNKPDNEE